MLHFLGQAYHSAAFIWQHASIHYNVISLIHLYFFAWVLPVISLLQWFRRGVITLSGDNTEGCGGGVGGILLIETSPWHNLIDKNNQTNRNKNNKK